MQRKAYKTFEDFVERASMVGLEQAWADRYRQTGRTTTEVMRAIHELCSRGGDSIACLAKNHEIARYVVQRVRDVLDVAGIPNVNVRAVSPTLGCSDVVIKKSEIMCVDHTWYEFAGTYKLRLHTDDPRYQQHTL